MGDIMLDDGIAQGVERLTAAASAKHLDDALAALRSLAPLATKLAADPAARARMAPVVYDLGLDLKEAHRLDAAEECLRAGNRLAHEAGDASLEASTANHLGVLGIEQGRLAFARRWFETALRLRVAAEPALTDAATVYLAGTDVNLGNVAADLRQLEEAAAHYEAATRRLEEARAAGSRVPALEPFLANATRGVSRTAEMRSWIWPPLTAATLAMPPSTQGLASAATSAWVGRRDEALAQAISAGDPRLQAFALGGFFDEAGKHAPWIEDDHHQALEIFDELLVDHPADADLRLAKARLIERGAHAARATGRALAGLRDKMAPDVASAALDLPARQLRGSLSRMQDAFVSAALVAATADSVTAEAAAAVEGLTSRPARPT